MNFLLKFSKLFVNKTFDLSLCWSSSYHAVRLLNLNLRRSLRSETIFNNWKPFKMMKNAFYFQLRQQLCDNVVTTSLLTLLQRCGKVENGSCIDASFRRCDNVFVGLCQCVATKLSQRRYNINQWLCQYFLITDNWQFFHYIKM